MIERISKRSPIAQSGQSSLANINEQYLSDRRINVPLSLSFLYEQYLFNNDTSGPAIPNAIS
jgi:hypothetical protein